MPPVNERRLDGRDARVGWIALLCGWLVLSFALFPSERVPELRPASAPAAEFSGERAMTILARILGDGSPHSAGTSAHSAVRERLLEELRALDVAAEIQETLARGPGGRIALVRNVVARLGAPEGRALLIASHYDSVGSSPGASDDGAGVAAMLEIARALQADGVDKPVILLFTDGEELGLVGANVFAEEHRWMSDVEVVINLEARGTFGPSMMFETSGPSAALIPRLAQAAVLPFASSLSDLIYKYMPNDTDLSVFRTRGVPGYNFAFIGGLSRYHTPLDDYAHLDPRSLQHHGDQALALLRELARAPLEHEKAGQAVYFDVLGLSIVRWSETGGIAAALVVASIAAWRCRRMLRARRVAMRGVWVATIGILCAFGASVVSSWSMTSVLAAWHAVPDPGAVSPTPLRVACAGLVLASFCGFAWLAARRRADFASAWMAGMVLTNLGAVGASIALARASHLALIPAFLWCAFDVLLDPTRSTSFARRIVPLVSVVLAQAVLWIPTAYATELGFGFRLGPMVAGPLAFVCLALWPGLLEVPARVLRFTAASGLAIVGVAVIVNGVLPARSPDAPAWINVRYILDGDANAARYEVSTFEAGLPDAMAKLHAFERATTAPFPWLSIDPSMYVVDAPVWDVPLPLVEVLASEPTESGRRVRARLTSPRGAVRLHLHCDEAVKLRSVVCAGRELNSGFEKVRTQLFFAVPQSGVEVEFDVQGEAPARVFLLDQDWALPTSMSGLLGARPKDFVPRSDGDVSVLGRSYVL